MIAKARASLVNASRGALGRRHDGCSAGTRGGSLASRGGGAPSAGLRLGLLLAVAAALLLVPASQAAAAAPEVTAISPDHGPWGESNAVTIEGSGFTGATAVDFGAVAAASFLVESDTEVLAHSPVQGGEPGDKVDVTVTTPEGTSASSVADEFEYTHEILKLNIEGSGAGEVVPLGGEFPELTGEPPIDCHYTPPAPASGDCEVAMSEEEGLEGVAMKPVAGANSEFLEWTTQAGNTECFGAAGCLATGEEGDVEMTAVFASTGQTLKLNIEGSGAGEVVPLGGEFPELTGEPPIDCHYTPPAPASGDCEVAMSEEEGLEGVAMKPVAGANSEFLEWTTQAGNTECFGAAGCLATGEEGDVEMTAVFASTGQTLKLNIEGSGAGEVVPLGGEFPELTGEPPIDCHYTPPAPASGDCEVAMSEEEGLEGVAMKPVAGANSEFLEWTTQAGNTECFGAAGCLATGEEGDVEMTAVFASTGQTLKLNIEGSGAGEVVPLGGEFPELTGEPPIDCHYTPPAPASGDCEVAMSEEEGLEGVAMKPVAGANSEFLEWTTQAGNTECFGAAGCLATGEEGDVEMTAVFASTGQTLKLNIEGSGAGEVVPLGGEFPELTGEPPIDCHYTPPAPASGDCEVAMSEEEGLEGVAMKPVAGANSEFLEWTTQAGNTECFGAAGCLATGEEGDVEMTAVFASTGPPTEFPLTIEVEGEGEVTGSGITCTESPASAEECEEEFAAGTEVPLTATAGGLSHFVGWTTVEGDAGTCTGTEASCATGELNAPAKLKAVFAPNTVEYTLTVEVEGPGHVTGPEGINCPEGSCSAEFPENEMVELTPVADPGAEFVEWQGACTGSGSCIVKMSEEKTVKAIFAYVPATLTVEASGEGDVEALEPPTPLSGGPIAGCVEGGTTECEATYVEGDVVTLKANPESGWEVASWTGCTEVGTDECELEMDTDHTVELTMVEIPTFPVEVSVTGEGEVTGEGIACPGDCEEDFAEGSTVTLTASDTVSGWTFAEWTEGPCAGSTNASCEFPMPASPVQAAAEFVEFNESALHTFKGGNGQGTIKSLSPDGQIDCGSECSAIYAEGEPVELEAEAAFGSLFVGWLGCHPVLGEEEKCHVEASGAETDVTAVFLEESESGETPTLTEFDGAEEFSLFGEEPCEGRGGVAIATASETKYVCNGTIGEDGEPGEDGEDGETPTITTLPVENAHCPYGGIEISLGAGHTYVCNGSNGTNGADGADGAAGPQGPAGSNGSNGSNGSDGAQGATGPQGPKGATGATAKVKVTCKVKNSKKVKCTVKVTYPKNNKRQHRRYHLRWRLMSGGHATSHGKTSVNRLNRVLGHLRPGRYVLHVNGQKTVIVIPAHRRHDNHRHG